MPHIKTAEDVRQGFFEETKEPGEHGSSTEAKEKPAGKNNKVAPYADSLAHAKYDIAATPIWQIAEDLAAEIAIEKWAQVPHDDSVRYKERLYGVKRHET